MPRETIQVGTPNNPAEVNVGWQNGGMGGSVQLSTIGIPDGQSEPDGMWVDLTRDDINRLIKNLRRARDGSYGKDE